MAKKLYKLLRTQIGTWEGLFFGLLLIAGIALRFLFLGRNNLWFDEGASLMIATKAPRFFFWDPPLYYTLLKNWITLFGASEFSIRFPSALLSSLALLGSVLLAQKMTDRKTALIMLVFICLSPLHLWYAQEARSYALCLFLGVLTTILLYDYLEKEKFSKAVLYAVFTTAGLCSNYFFILLFLSQLIVFAVLKKNKSKNDLFFLLPVLLFAPQAVKFIKQASFWSHGFWIPQPTLASFITTLENLILGYNGTSLLYGLTDLLILLCLFAFLLALRKTKKYPKGITLCFLLTFLPIVFSLGVSLTFKSFYLDRGFLMLTPYFYILLGWSIAHGVPPRMRQALILCAFLILLAGDMRYFSGSMYEPGDPRHHVGVLPKKPFRPLADFLNANVKDEDCVLTATWVPFHSVPYYLKRDIGQGNRGRFFFFVYDPTSLDSNSLRPNQKIYKRHFALPQEDMLKRLEKIKGRIFLLGACWLRNGNLDENSAKVKSFFDRHFGPAKQLDFDGIEVFIYDRKH